MLQGIIVMQWHNGRAFEFRLRETRFVSYDAMLDKFIHSTLLQLTQPYINEYLAIDSGGYFSVNSPRTMVVLNVRLLYW